MTSIKNLPYALGLAIATFLPANLSNQSNTPQRYFQPSYFFEMTSVTREEITIPISDVVSMYTDCDLKNYTGRKPVRAKTNIEIISGVKRRRNLEESWTRYFNEKVSTGLLNPPHIDTTQGFVDPLNGEGIFEDGFNYIRIRAGRWKERHGAIDIFAKEGTPIYAPVSGIVVASADDWKGSWVRRKGLVYEEGGLGRLSGNGILLFNPIDTSYLFMIHMKNVYANSGDVVSRGEAIGTIGRTGNAMSPYTTPHLHFAGKKPGISCGVNGTLVAKNPFEEIRDARNLLLIQRRSRKTRVSHE